jgi:hypothetical protein
MIYKNWPCDVKVGCNITNVDVAKFFVVEVVCSNIMKLNWGR